MIARRWGQLRLRRQMLVVGAAAFTVRLAYLLATGVLSAPPPDYNEQVRIARYLSHGAGFVCPVGPERDDPSSWYSPGFIALTALHFRVFGEATTASWVAIRLTNLALHAAALSVWFAIARGLLGRRAAALAAVLMIFSPPLVYEARQIWDTHLLLLAGGLGTAAFVFVPIRRHRTAAAAGAVCGAIAYVNPCLTLCYPLWWVWNRRSILANRASTPMKPPTTDGEPRASARADILSRSTTAFGMGRSNRDFQSIGTTAPPLPRGLKPTARSAERITRAQSGHRRLWLSALIAFVVTIMPWTLRNRVVFGDWFYMRGNLGMELWVGAAPWSEGSIISIDNQRVHPVFDEVEARRMVEMGEYAYFKACMSEALRWWKSEPRRMAHLTLNRAKWFWLGRYPPGQSSAARAVKAIGVTFVGAGGLLGAILLLRSRRRAWIIPAMLLVFPLPYYLTITAVRYRLPIEPALLLALAWLLSSLGRRLRRVSRPASAS